MSELLSAYLNEDLLYMQGPRQARGPCKRKTARLLFPLWDMRTLLLSSAVDSAYLRGRLASMQKNFGSPGQAASRW
jgi:hypothetical protein